MFKRPVLMPNGTVSNYHRVGSLEHVLDSTTYVNVQSTEDTPVFDGNWSETQVSHEFDPTLTFQQAEDYVKGLDSFQPYVDPLQEAIDQLLPTLDDDQAETVIGFFHEWESGKAYAVGDRVRYQGVLYRCIQAHTSQDDWTPDATASLWVRTSPASEDDDPETVPEWVQPTGAAGAYDTGDRVTFDGAVYESTVDGNVWSPADYPQGWRLVE